MTNAKPEEPDVKAIVERLRVAAGLANASKLPKSAKAIREAAATISRQMTELYAEGKRADWWKDYAEKLATQHLEDLKRHEATIVTLTAERDHFEFNHKVCFDAHSSAMDRAIAAEQRVKELEEGRDLDKVVLDEGIEIINELESSNKLLSERVAVLENSEAYNAKVALGMASRHADLIDRHNNIVEECALIAENPDIWKKYEGDFEGNCIAAAIRRARTALEGK